MDDSEIAERIRSDFFFFAENFLVIQDKRGLIVPFKAYKAQRKLISLAERMVGEGRPVRIIILKSRQLGFSTLIQMYFLWRTLMVEGSKCLTMAHKRDTSEELFGKIEFSYRNLPEALKTELDQFRSRAVTGRELSFGSVDGIRMESSIRVDTAAGKDSGRGYTFRRGHFSEAAFWPNLTEALTALLATFPDDPDTELFIETTANGMGDPFQLMWDKNYNDPDSEWECLFVGWNEDETIEFVDPPKHFRLTNEENRYMTKHKLERKHMWWRRKKISQFNGDVSLFQQEYPLTPDEAFIVSGNPYLDRKALATYSDATRPPIAWGNFEMVKDQVKFLGSSSTAYEHGKSFVETGAKVEESPWHIWRKPIKDHCYVIGVDPAGGTSEDSSAIHVLDITANEVVATYRNKLDPDQLAYQARWGALLYNTALIAPERNGEGRATLITLIKVLNYPRIFYHQSAEAWDGGVEHSYGWKTTSKTRPLMLAELASTIREKELKLYCERTVSEMRSFVRVAGTRIAEHTSGGHDDMVMSLAIANSSEARQLAYFVASVNLKKWAEGTNIV